MVPWTEALKRIPMAPGFFLPVRSVRSRMEFLCLGFGPSRVDDRLREIRILESGKVVLEGDDGSAHAFALEDGAPVIFFGLVGGRPLEGRGNLVDAVREVDDVVAVRVVAQGLLDGLGIVGLSVALGVIGFFLDIDDVGTHGELHLGVGKQGGRAENRYKRAQRNH